MRTCRVQSPVYLVDGGDIYYQETVKTEVPSTFLGGAQGYLWYGPIPERRLKTSWMDKSTRWQMRQLGARSRGCIGEAAGRCDGMPEMADGSLCSDRDDDGN